MSKCAWTSPNGIEIEILPFMSNGWKFTTLKMMEVVGGRIAEGEVSLTGVGTDESLELVTEEHYINITIKIPDGGVSYDIQGFIMSKSWTQNILDIKFVCIPDKKFFTEPQVLLYNDITKALKQLWGNNKTLDIRCKSDINNEIVIQQHGESSYSLCKKLASSFKRNSIFCFGLEGFMIKDMIGKDSKGNDEPRDIVLGDGQVTQTSSYGMNYNYRLYKEVEDPWKEEYSDCRKSKLVSAVTMDNEYYLVAPNYNNMLSNYLYNKNIMESKMFTSLTIVTPNSLPEFKIGDTIKYKRSTEKNWNPFTTFFVSKMTYFISTEEEKDENGLGFSVTAVLRGVQEDGETMPKKDKWKKWKET